MTTPLVSVVMIVRNGEKFIAAAIESILAQDYRPIEIIVVDGNSSDRTAEIAQSFTSVRFMLQTKTGVADAYNVGIEAAQGEFIAFLSHDDLWIKDKLTAQMSYLLQHPDVLYTIGNVRFFLNEGSTIPKGFQKHLLEGEHVGYIMETFVGRKRVFDLVGKFDSDLRISNDTDWYARAKDLHIPMTVLPQVVLLKRVHDSNTTADVDRVQRDILRVMRQSIQRKKSEQRAGTESRPHEQSDQSVKATQ